MSRWPALSNGQFRATQDPSFDTTRESGPELWTETVGGPQLGRYGVAPELTPKPRHLIGYACGSTLEQNVQAQADVLQAAGRERIFTEQAVRVAPAELAALKPERAKGLSCGTRKKELASCW